MKNQKQQGSTHVIIVAVLSVAIIGLIGVLFWQNIINKKVDADKQSTTTDSKTTPAPSTIPTSIVDSVTEAKTTIGQVMNLPGYEGLEHYMAASVDSAIAHSDGVYHGESGAVVTSRLDKYFKDFATSNKTTPVTTWKFEEFDKTTNAQLKKEAANTTFFDFKGTYVGVGEGANSNLFVAYRINGDGKITYVFYGPML